MGANVSQEIDAAASESVSIVNSQTQKCVTMGSQAQAISVCTGNTQLCPNGTSNVDIENVNFNQSAIYTTQCTSDINITSDIQSEISQAFQQAATAIAQQFQLSAANVDQVAKISAKIATGITNKTVQDCIQNVSQNQGITVSCSPNGSGACNVTIKQINFEQGFTPINNCILQEQNVQSVINQVTQAISQEGTAKVESIFGPLIAIIIVIIVIIGAVLFGGTKALGDWRLWVVVIVLLLIYLALAFWRHWFPFEHKSS